MVSNQKVVTDYFLKHIMRMNMRRTEFAKP